LAAQRTYLYSPGFIIASQFGTTLKNFRRIYNIFKEINRSSYVLLGLAVFASNQHFLNFLGEFRNEWGVHFSFLNFQYLSGYDEYYCLVFEENQEKKLFLGVNFGPISIIY